MKLTLIKKADIFLILFFLVVGISLFAFNVFGKEEGNTVKITVNGKIYGNYSLNIDREIKIEHDGHVNIVSIKNKKVFMESANCEGQDCVRSGKVSRASVPIVCSPNGVVVVITGGDLDAVAW